jgi:hypothetical protein
MISDHHRSDHSHNPTPERIGRHLQPRPSTLTSTLGFRNKTSMLDPSSALPGRDQEMPVAARNVVAEDSHQQYLHKNPWGYCGLGGTGVSCPVGAASV